MHGRIMMTFFAGNSGLEAKFRIMDAKNLALTVLGKTLQSRGYRFVAMTPGETPGEPLPRARPSFTCRDP